ncbi:MFS transporter [Pelosinus propionicus]|uniref:Predicted arabinose efflux permease, MFS family n=1 Tax=Pelosinus propionicus DSM 13327 TaxID=1123291 RepID=A0A1I4NIX6_9FIRM|nr:MFS transporter [Pelosinus propionicus]SFM15474.1 Predicted arabinose efflux permease, MFS family [Pelosinus propionicus DSM 13327]
MPEQKPQKKFIASNIVILGFVSFFTDISTEMIYPILPLYLTSVMGVSPAIIGVIEGIAESLASILKLFSGMIADKYNNKRQLAFIGYIASFFNKVIILLSVTWGGVLLARIVDRFGKGIRTAPRDALVAEAAENGSFGKAYGLHKAFDMMGASIGILLAFFLMGFSDESSFRNIFIISMIPALIGPLCIFFVRDEKKQSAPKKLDFKWKSLDRRLKLFLIIIFIFTLGNSSNSFILLRAYHAGFSEREAILLYFIFNIVASALSYPIGNLSDKVGHKYTLCAGYFLYAVVYLGIGLLSSNSAFWGLFAIYGVYTALTAGGERALIAETAPPHLKGSALGLHSAIVGIGLLPASLIAGFLWDAVGQAAPFVLGGCLALFASIAVFFVLNMKTATIE